MSLLYRVWRYGGGDWLEPWRIYHGLDADFRPVDEPSKPAHRPTWVRRYRHLLYGFAKAAAIMEEGAKDKPPRPVVRDRAPRPGEVTTPSGLILPTGSGDGPR